MNPLTLIASRKRRVLTLILLLIALCVLILQLGMPAARAQVPGIIIDQDMSSDHDDVGDLAVLNALANLGECQILACMTDSQNGATPLCQNAICTYYGNPNVPVGVPPDLGGVGGYPGTIASEFPHPLYQTAANCPSAVNLYRQILASQPDHSVTIVTTGFLNNLQTLLQSGPDQYSSLTGSALVAQKVKLLAAAAGLYPSGGEFNLTVVPAAAYYVVNNWPAPAMYDGYDIGQPIYSGGALQSTSMNNPVRRAWELTFWGPYPTWGQIAIYNAVRGAEGLWNANTIGSNSCDQTGVDAWKFTGTPGQYSQGYLLDKVRSSAQEVINALIMAPPRGGSTIPSPPSDVRATVTNGNTINLQWADNSFNESGFIIQRGLNGVYTQIGSVGANISTYSDQGLSSTSNISYRVQAYNSTGNSAYSSVWVYSGWTEINFDSPSNLPLYTYYQTCDLESVNASAQGLAAAVAAGTATAGTPPPTLNNHVSLNNNSTHGQNLTVNVAVSGFGAQGAFYIYFFYQNPTNWYRLNVGAGASKFEKSINGTISPVGAAGPGVPIGNGSQLQQWQVVVSSVGTLQFLTDWGTNENVSPASARILNVTDTLSFATGKIGLGGVGSTPVWQNFNFNTLTGVAQPPVAPTGVSATPGNNQVTVSWTPVSGVTSYNVYAARGAGGEGATPLASGLTSPSYINMGLTNGTTSFYKVAAVNSAGGSSYSYEVSATPGTTVTTLVPNGVYEITPQSTGMALTANGSATAPSVVQDPYSGAATQQWTVTNLGNNVVELNCVGNNQALEAPGSTPINGAYLDTATSSGGANQLWQLVSASGAYYQIVNLNSSLGANVAFGSAAAGIGICQYALSNASNSVFAFTAVSGSTKKPNLLSAASIQQHAGTPYPIALPLTGVKGVECREINGAQQIVFTFDQPMTSGTAQLSTANGTVSGSPAFAGDTMTVNLTGIIDAQNFTLQVSGLNGTSATGSIAFGVLLGDVTGDGVVNSRDQVAVRNAVGTQSGSAGFSPANDVNKDGAVNSQDLIQVRNHTGDQLP